MPLIKSKQVEKLFAGKVYASGTSALVVPQNTTKNDLDVTAQLTALVATAGDQGTAVPMQSYMNGADRVEGFVTTVNNIVEVYDANKDKIKNTAGNEIFGRLTVTGAPAVPATDTELGQWSGRTAVATLIGANTNGVDLRAALTTAVTNYHTTYPTKNTRQTAHYNTILAAKNYITDGNQNMSYATILSPGVEAAAGGAPGAMPAGTASTEVFALSFFTNAGAADIAYEFEGGTDVAGTTYNLNFVYPYLFTFEHLPYDFATSLKSVFVNDDPKSAGGVTTRFELAVPSALNTFDPLTYEHVAGTKATMTINGQVVSSTSGAFAIDAVTFTPIWDEDAAGFAIETTDVIYIEYQHNGTLV